MNRTKTIVVTAIFLILAFILGYVPKELERRRLEATLEQTQVDLRLANLQRQLGVATLEAERNNFAVAESTARAFFDGCRAVVAEHTFEDQPRTRIALSAWPNQADMILGELANGDPIAKQRLASLYLTMDGVLQRRQ